MIHIPNLTEPAKRWLRRGTSYDPGELVSHELHSAGIIRVTTQGFTMTHYGDQIRQALLERWEWSPPC